MTEELLKALKREMKKRGAMHCVYGFTTANGSRVVADAKKARYFTSEKAFEKWAKLVRLTECTILALHPHHIGK